MASRALLSVAVAAALITACDWSQKKPETGSLPAAALMAGPAAGGHPMSGPFLQVPGHPVGVLTGESATGEKSIRLFGPGVSRKRQIRV